MKKEKSQLTDRITIPPEALEAAAMAAHEQWRFNMACAFGLEMTDYEPWDDLPQERRDELISEARAAALALLENWPGMEHQLPDEWSNKPHIILPLNTETDNDKA